MTGIRYLFVFVLSISGCDCSQSHTRDASVDGAADAGEDVLDVLSNAYLEGSIHHQVRFCECFYELATHPDVETCLAAQPEVSVSSCETDALRTEPPRYEAFLRCGVAENERIETCYEECPASPDVCTPVGEPSDCASLLSASQIEAWQACFS